MSCLAHLRKLGVCVILSRSTCGLPNGVWLRANDASAFISMALYHETVQLYWRQIVWAMSIEGAGRN